MSGFARAARSRRWISGASSIGDDKKALKDLKMIVAGRVVRKLCDACKIDYTPDPDTLRKMNLPADRVSRLFTARTTPLKDSRGHDVVCDFCYDLRFRGRVGVFEVLLPVQIYYGCEVTGFAQDDTGVDVRLSDGEPLRARYLVGCDGGRSLIRKAAGIEFPGWDPTRSNLIAEVELTEEPPPGVRHDAIGVHGLHRMEDGKTFRVVVTEQQLGPGSEPTLRDLSEALITVYGTDFGIHNPTWISRFTDMTRQAAAYRVGRVLLAGDAAHVHYPAGGQGLSLGVQDAVNLGWKLAQVVDGNCPESLLDTYQDERHPVAARALRHTMAQTALQRRDERIEGPGRCGVGAGEHGRASQAARRDLLRAGHSFRPRRGTSAARTPHARSGPGDRRRPAPSLRAAARRPAAAAQPR